ncbi:MAG TPA: hypothetical protein DCG48_08445 [Rhodospirillaceae bacterium]|nr:hypothetical protein [Rhodospirillaceae bacterium]|tara:strand:- start:14659 stop:15507 length:849 start_codon:yes stop_codon:yes gene_type:complete
MVTRAFPLGAGRKGWAAYLFLSLAVNAYAAYATGLGPEPSPPAAPPVLKISLSAVAAPRPAAAEAAPPVAATAPIERRDILPVETESLAQNRITRQIVAPKAEAAPTLAPIPPREVEPELLSEPPVEAAPIIRPEPLPLPAKRPQRPLPKTEPPVETARSAPPEPAPAEADPTPPTEVAAVTPDEGRQTATVIHDANYRRRTPPLYPRRALEMGQQGQVLLHAEILPNGRPRALKIAESSGHRLLDVAALAAVRDWRFEPSNIDGAAVTSWVRVPVQFVIQR